MIAGPSYGGFIALAAAAAYRGRLRGVNPAFAITDFPGFLETTDMSRQADRNAEYAIWSNPEMRAFLTRISPLTNAAKLKTPVFIAAADTRVPTATKAHGKALEGERHAGVARSPRTLATSSRRCRRATSALHRVMFVRQYLINWKAPA